MAFHEYERFSHRDLAAEIAKIPRGQSIQVSRFVLDRVVVPAGWAAAEWIMESIIGSSYNFRFSTDPLSGNVTFFHLITPLVDGRFTYVSPDRRDRVQQDHDGYYVSRAP